MKIFINNFAADVKKDQLKALFEIYGDVQEIAIIRDKFTQESRGFGYVKMPLQEQGVKAVRELNGKVFQGQKLHVNVARTSLLDRKGTDRRQRLKRNGNSTQEIFTITHF